MSEYIRADKQLLAAVFGIATSFITGIILGLIEVHSGYALYSWVFWVVIPVGQFYQILVLPAGTIKVVGS